MYPGYYIYIRKTTAEQIKNTLQHLTQSEILSMDTVPVPAWQQNAVRETQSEVLANPSCLIDEAVVMKMLA